MRRPTLPHHAVRNAAVCALLALSSLGAARAEAGAPTETLRTTFADANRIISDPATRERPLDRLVAIRTLFSRIFDSRGAAERALGREWQVRTVAEQNEFTALFARFVQRGFVNWLASVAEVDGNGITVQYLGEAPERDGAVVRVALARNGGRQVLLDHEMVYRSRRWMVRDVTIDGISLLANYRSQFDRVIRTSSYRGLVERMQERLSVEMLSPPPAASVPVNADLYKSRPLELR